MTGQSEGGAWRRTTRVLQLVLRFKANLGHLLVREEVQLVLRVPKVVVLDVSPQPFEAKSP